MYEEKIAELQKRRDRLSSEIEDCRTNLNKLQGMLANLVRAQGKAIDQIELLVELQREEEQKQKEKDKDGKDSPASDVRDKAGKQR